MPAAGRKPVEGPKRNRVKPVHDWTLVADIPYDDDKPSLPSSTMASGKRAKLLEQTKQWWDVVSSMPHCVMWTAGDWLFALETVYVAEAVFRGDMVRAAELRTRCKQMGTTLDARRDLRIKYVDPKEIDGDGDEGEAKKKASGKKGGGSNVTSMEARRRRLTSDAS